MEPGGQCVNKQRISIKRKIIFLKEPKRNSGTKKYNNLNEKLTTGFQQQQWARRKKIRELEDRSTKSIQCTKHKEK